MPLLFRYLMIFTFILWSFSQNAKACAFWLKKSPPAEKTLFIETAQGHRIFTKISYPKKAVKGWYFLVHGLLDSHQSYSELAKDLHANGFGVVRVDLYGFGETLKDYVTSSKEHKIPSEISADEQAKDLRDVLSYLKVNHRVHQPTLIGHSMGGGIILNLLAQLKEQTDLVGPQVFLLAPYVYRLEYYELGKRSPMLRTMLEYLPGIAKAGPEAYLDTMVSEPSMRKIFKEFIIKLDASRRKNIESTDVLDDAWIEQQIAFAIAAVKGLRELNSIELVEIIPKELNINLIVGTRDQLVELDLQKELSEMILKRENSTYLEVESGHMLLDEVPKIILQKVLPNP